MVRGQCNNVILQGNIYRNGPPSMIISLTHLLVPEACLCFQRLNSAMIIEPYDNLLVTHAQLVIISNDMSPHVKSYPILLYRRKIQNTLSTFCKEVFPPLLAAILNFWVKRNNVFILEMEQDRAILTKFLYLESVLTNFLKKKKTFSHHFWQPS